MLPITIGTTTTTKFGTNPCLGFAANRHWVFYYSSSTTFVCRSSKDLINWTDEVVIRSGSGIVAIFIDDNGYLHYAYCGGGDVYYRKGKLNEDGSISWVAPEQVVYSAGAGEECYYPDICVNNDGYPFIGFFITDTGAGQSFPEGTPYITKSSKNDGTWATDSGFPVQLSTTVASHWQVRPRPLSGNKVYITYCFTSWSPHDIYGRLWDGSLGSEEIAMKDYGSIYTVYGVTVDNDDNVHLLSWAPYYGDVYLYYNKRDINTGWGSEVKLYGPVENHKRDCSISCDAETGTVYVFWLGEKSLKLLTCKKGGSWDSEPIILIEDESPLTDWCGPMASFKKYERYIGIMWRKGNSSPYSMRYAVLGFLPSSLKSNSHSI